MPPRRGRRSSGDAEQVASDLDPEARLEVRRLIMRPERTASQIELFCLHVAAALGLGGAEVNPLCFQPFGGYGDDMRVVAGATEPPTVPGIGFELKRSPSPMIADARRSAIVLCFVVRVAHELARAVTGGGR